MHEELARRYNECVGPDDTVYVVGDVAMGKIKETLPLVSAFGGHKILICGNHDRAWSGATGHGKPSEAAVQMYLDAGFEEVWNTTPQEPAFRMQIGEHWVKVSHFPYQDVGRHTDRFTEWLPSPDSKLPWAEPATIRSELWREHPTDWLLHGHLHADYRQRGHQIDVGVDSWSYYPVSDEEIMKLIEAGPRDLPPLPKK